MYFLIFYLFLVPVSSIFRSNLALESRCFVLPSYARHLTRNKISFKSSARFNIPSKTNSLAKDFTIKSSKPRLIYSSFRHKRTEHLKKPIWHHIFNTFCTSVSSPNHPRAHTQVQGDFMDGPVKRTGSLNFPNDAAHSFKFATTIFKHSRMPIHLASRRRFGGYFRTAQSVCCREENDSLILQAKYCTALKLHWNCLRVYLPLFILCKHFFFCCRTILGYFESDMVTYHLTCLYLVYFF